MQIADLLVVLTWYVQCTFYTVIYLNKYYISTVDNIMSYKKPKNRGIYLIGTTIETLTGAKLPSNRQILGRFLHLHLKDNFSIQKSALNYK